MACTREVCLEEGEEDVRGEEQPQGLRREWGHGSLLYTFPGKKLLKHNIQIIALLESLMHGFDNKY